MKIGVFGGAFNPVHNGHLHLINTMSKVPMYPDMKPIDKLLVIPTANPPHRESNLLAGEQDRINMLSLALESDKAEISDIEFHLKGKSYTFNTLKALKKLYPNDELFLFIGSDQLLAFRQWYKYEKILGLADVVAMSRSREDNERVKQYLIENGELGINAVEYSPLEVSSSEIRERLKKGESIRGLVPENVEKYIEEHRLYV